MSGRRDFAREDFGDCDEATKSAAVLEIPVIVCGGEL